MGEIKLIQKFQKILVTDFLAILSEVTGNQQHIRFFCDHLLHTLPEYRITEFDQFRILVQVSLEGSTRNRIILKQR